MKEKPYKIGQKYFIRTVTMHLIGELVDVFDKELVIKNASWIADSGRFANALQTGELEEIEPFPDGEVILGRGSIIDVCIWKHDLPRKIK